jgi:hypothetical protein
MTIRRLGIIGTAGRKDDAPKMSRALYDRMCTIARSLIAERDYTHLVSGGAAWADHVAVTLTLEGLIPAPHLTLHLPARLIDNAYSTSTRDGGVANHYHRLFHQKAEIDGLADLHAVSALGADLRVNPSGFKARNSDIARDSTGLLAFTFGTGKSWSLQTFENVNASSAGLKDGGTADTFTKCQAAEKFHVCLDPNVELLLEEDTSEDLPFGPGM